MKVVVDRNKCSGIGLCEVTAPTVFEVGDDGQSQVINEQPAAAEMPTVEEAIGSCPTGALSVADERTE
jgi:ferredoxin